MTSHLDIVLDRKLAESLSLEDVVLVELGELHVGVLPHPVHVVPVLRPVPVLIVLPQFLKLEAVVVPDPLTLQSVVLSQLLQLDDPAGETIFSHLFTSSAIERAGNIIMTILHEKEGCIVQ